MWVEDRNGLRTPALYSLKHAALIFLSALFICCGILSPDAHAQLIEQYFPAGIPGYTGNFSSSVLDRMFNQSESNGIEVGDFIIRPFLSEEAGFDSDTLGTSNSGSSEIHSEADFRVNSNWDRDAIGATLGVDRYQYLDLPASSYTDWNAQLGGNLDLGNDTLTVAYSHLNRNLSATQFGVQGVVSPVPYSVDDARISYLKLFSRFSITPLFEFLNFSFGQSAGPVAINYDTLSHEIVNGRITGRYELGPGDAAIVVLGTSRAWFTTASYNDYQNTEGFLGFDSRKDSVVQYRLLLGGEGRAFKQGVAKPIITPAFQFDAIWGPTQIDTVTASAVRMLDDPSSPFALNETITDGRLQWDHQLRVNLFLEPYFEGATSESATAVANSVTANQTQLQFGLNTTWNLTRHLRATFSYNYTDSNTRNNNSDTIDGSTIPGNFVGHNILFGINLFE